jgi:hypothetical protein
MAGYYRPTAMSARAPRRLPTASHPQRLGSAYAKLWAAVSASDIGDGIYYTALPLLAATITRDPLQVATVEAAGGPVLAGPPGPMPDRRALVRRQRRLACHQLRPLYPHIPARRHAASPDGSNPGPGRASPGLLLTRGHTSTAAGLVKYPGALGGE